MRYVRFQLPFQPVNATHGPNGLGALRGAPNSLNTALSYPAVPLAHLSLHLRCLGD
jgi:hypothetical protein